MHTPAARDEGAAVPTGPFADAVAPPVFMLGGTGTAAPTACAPPNTANVDLGNGTEEGGTEEGSTEESVVARRSAATLARLAAIVSSGFSTARAHIPQQNGVERWNRAIKRSACKRYSFL